MQRAIVSAAALALVLGGGIAQAQTGQGQSQASAALSDQQRARIGQAVARLNVAPLRSINFALSVGSEVPRTLRLRPLPAAAIESAPQYRGHHFVLVKEEIVIVEPRTYKIAAVLPQSRPANIPKQKLNLSERQRATIRAEVSKQAARQAKASQRRMTTGAAPPAEIVIGERIPEWIVIERFPDNVYRQVPALRTYQYILRESDIYVVDPRELRVIELVE